MPRSVLMLALTLALLFGGAPAQAIIGGVPDGEEHPNVGGMVARFTKPDPDVILLLCTGSLVAPDLFVTAAHCSPEFFPDEWGPTELGVSFDTRFDPATSPIIWAEEMVLHPDYDDDAWPFTPDMAVIRLKAAVEIEPVDLPPAGLIDEIRGEPAFRRQELTQVGYGQVGVTHGGGLPQEIYPDVRKHASAWLRHDADYGGSLDPQYVFKTSHPGGPGGDGGGTCYGDSGGPLFLGDETSNLQVGVHSGGWHVGPDDVLCRISGWDLRLDTATARGFLCDQEVEAACGAAVAAERTAGKQAATGKKDAKAKQGDRDRRGGHKRRGR